MGRVNRGRGEERDKSLLCHTFAVYDKFRTVTVRSHEYCFVVYLLLGPFRSSINDFEQLHRVSPSETPYSICLKGIPDRTHSIGDPLCESYELNVVARALPVRIEGQDQP